MTNKTYKKINERPQTKPISRLSNHKMTENSPRVILPLPPQAGEETRFEMDIYVRFMRHLRDVPNSRMEIKILAAICFAADALESSDALIAKTLVDLGLKAPRKAFPVSFLDFVDKGMMRTNWDHGSLPPSIVQLHYYWHKIGEDRFSYGVSEQYSVYLENNYVYGSVL